MYYYIYMRYTLTEFKDMFCGLVGDTARTTPDTFFINGVNWAIGQLPLVPKLGKLFSKHYKRNLDAKGNYKWNLSPDFRRATDIPMLNFYTSTGGSLCKLGICPKDVVEFYDINGIIELKEPGTPCQYTLEQEDDGVYLVFDRPLNVPIILDYIVYGFPKPVKTMEDVIELSAVAEPLVVSALRQAWYMEADDFSFAGNILDYLDNKQIPEAIEMLYKRFGSDEISILGEA